MQLSATAHWPTGHTQLLPSKELTAKLRVTQLEWSTSALYYSATAPVTTADLNEIKTKSQKVIWDQFFQNFFSADCVVKNSSNDDDSRSFAAMKLECGIVLKNLSIDDDSKSFAATKTRVLFHSISLWKTCQMAPIQEVLSP